VSREGTTNTCSASETGDKDIPVQQRPVLYTYGNGKHCRTIADMLLIDGTNINCESVKADWC